MFFHWSLGDSKSPQVSRTLLSILAVLSDTLVWMVFTSPPTSKSSSPLVIVPDAPITICIIVTCMFHSFCFFFNSLAKVEVLILLFTFFWFYSVVSRDSKVDILQILFFFCGLLLVLVFWSRLGDPCVCESPIGVNVCFFLGQVLGCAYTICSYGHI